VFRQQYTILASNLSIRRWNFNVAGAKVGRIWTHVLILATTTFSLRVFFCNSLKQASYSRWVNFIVPYIQITVVIILQKPIQTVYIKRNILLIIKNQIEITYLPIISASPKFSLWIFHCVRYPHSHELIAPTFGWVSSIRYPNRRCFASSHFTNPKFWISTNQFEFWTTIRFFEQKGREWNGRRRKEKKKRRREEFDLVQEEKRIIWLFFCI